MAKRYNPETQTYTSPRPPVHFPTNPNLSLTTFLFRSTLQFPDSPALLDSDSGDSLTFHHLKLHVSRLSHALHTLLGLAKNDVVLILSPNSIHFPVFFLAVTSLGAVVSTCNPAYRQPEISKQVADCRPKLIVTVKQLLQKVKHFNLPIVLLNHDRFINNNNNNDPKIFHYSDLIESFPGVTDLPRADVTQDDVAGLMYSSGTTGTSKGVVLTHGNFIAASVMTTADQDRYEEQKHVVLCFLPMFHIFGLLVINYAQLRRGNTVVSMEKFELEKALACVERYRVTQLYAVPPVMVAVGKRRDVVARFDLSSLEVIAAGAAPLGKDVMEECSRNLLPHLQIIQGYGMTETCGIISLEDRKDENGRLSGSVGVLVPGVESQIISVDTSKPLPPNQRGEICLRGPNIMKGYLNNPETTKLTIDERGWLHSGDLGYFDEAGQLFVVDRIKDLIKCYAFQVAPAELEGLLLSHPEILDAAVIPFPDDKAGEVPIGFVVRAPKSSLTEEDVQKFISDQVAPYKRVRRVTFVNGIPKSAAGKILKKEMLRSVRSRV